MLITSLIISTILSCLAGIGCAYWLLEKRLKKQTQNHERQLREAQAKIYDIEQAQQQKLQLLHTEIQALEAENQKHTTEKVKLENQLKDQIKSLENEHIQKLAFAESKAQETRESLTDKYSRQVIDLERNCQHEIQENNRYWQVKYHEMFQELEVINQQKNQDISKYLQEKYQQEITKLENEHEQSLAEIMKYLEENYQNQLQKKIKESEEIHQESMLERMKSMNHKHQNQLQEKIKELKQNYETQLQRTIKSLKAKHRRQIKELTNLEQ